MRNEYIHNKHFFLQIKRIFSIVFFITCVLTRDSFGFIILLWTFADQFKGIK